MLVGLGQSSLVDSIAQAIYQMEGNGPTTIATRNNNPGNLRSGPGQTGSNGGYAVFPDMATGWAALDNQIQLNIDRGLTMYEFFGGKPGVYAGYAPSADSNNPVNYANFVASQVGVDPNVPLNQLDSSLGTDTGSTDSGSADNSGVTSDTNVGMIVAIAAVAIGGILLISGGIR